MILGIPRALDLAGPSNRPNDFLEFENPII